MYNLKKFFQLTYNRFRYPELLERERTPLSRYHVTALFSLMTHPLRTFDEIKFEKRGSLALANFMALAFLATHIFSYFETGFLFTTNEPSDFSLLSTIVSSLGILLLWAVCNWITGTFLEGEGTFREIWIITCYSTVPYVLIQVPLVLISPVLTLSEARLFETGMLIAQGWMFILLFCGVMIMQQFNVSNTMLSVLLTASMMISVILLLVLFFSIFQQMVGFVSTVITELNR